jgi:hypothetical protein
MSYSSHRKNRATLFPIAEFALFVGPLHARRRGARGQRPRQWLALVLVVLLAGLSASGAELKQETQLAFEHYVKLSEAQIDAELARGTPFLWVDQLPAERRQVAYGDLRQGRTVIERLETRDNGQRINAPGGLIHHWIGTVFIPGATLAQALALLQDYDHQSEYYQPDIARSKILRHSGNDFVVSLRFYKKKILTSVVDGEHHIHYQPVNATREWSRSHTTSVREVVDAGKPNERLASPQDDHGYLWLMNTYWRFEQKTAAPMSNANPFRSRATSPRAWAGSWVPS